MKSQILTVADILKRPLFEHAKVLAGEKGLTRPVRWVHVLEVADIGSLLHGDELILSTGAAFKNDLELQASYMRQLIERNASGLCIELGYSLDHIPPLLLEIAKQEDFPLIHFQQPVRFIDVTQDINSYLINRHHQILEQLDAISREFQRLTLNPQATKHTLKLLHQYTGKTVVYRLFSGEEIYYPTQDEPPLQGGHRLSLPIQAMGNEWGELVLLTEDEPNDEYLSLVLDRAATAIAQDFMRKMSVAERQLHAENQLMDDLLQGKYDSEEKFWLRLGFRKKEATSFKQIICVVDWDESAAAYREEDFELVITPIAMFFRTSMERQSFKPYLAVRGERLVIVAIDLQSKQAADRISYKDRLQHIFNQCGEMLDKQGSSLILRFGVGRPFHKWGKAKLAYTEALQIIDRTGNDLPALPYFYEDLGVNRILFNQSHPEVLEEFVHDYLGPVIDQDLSKGTELLKTLKIFLDCEGSKLESANRLFIHRQTLYHRLEKLSELLGENYMGAEKRLSIELALRAYRLLHPQSKLLH